MSDNTQIDNTQMDNTQNNNEPVELSVSKEIAAEEIETLNFTEKDAMAVQEAQEAAVLKEDKELIEMRLNELKVSVSTMTENEVKSKSNKLRTTLDRDEKTLKNIFKELKLHRADVEDLKKKRDALNAQVRDLSKTAQVSRNKRDEVNQKIAELKGSRTTEMADTKSKSEEINQMKARRDECNKISQSTFEGLSKGYRAEIKTFLEMDINLEHEKSSFEKLLNLSVRLEAAKEANVLHHQMKEFYESNKGMYQKSDELSAEIKQLSDESQKYHLEMIEMYRKVDELRKEADGYHKRLTERYAMIKPISAKIDPLKKSIAITRRELDIYLERGKDFQAEKDEKRVDKIHDSAKEKLKQNGRLSLEDLGALIEKGDIKFNK
ncbi:DUF7121 family protein [Methanolapillus ohkumae]|uniref:Phosphoserine phosphatase n=1 Tax=Methanolapillus ohkumae TaxID=3028298 RepID=A0AA96VHM9_9EURY|nr:hypothetical protein MsAm2_04590 [Methanosarcinaceae archaeon Am2]